MAFVPISFLQTFLFQLLKCMLDLHLSNCFALWSYDHTYWLNKMTPLLNLLVFNFKNLKFCSVNTISLKKILEISLCLRVHIPRVYESMGDHWTGEDLCRYVLFTNGIFNSMPSSNSPLNHWYSIFSILFAPT